MVKLKHEQKEDEIWGIVSEVYARWSEAGTVAVGGDDDAFSSVPYVKGFIFLYYLENLVNSKSSIDLFRKILRTYFTKFKYKSITYDDFKQLFSEQVKENLPSEAENILNQIDWEKWIEEPGFPPIDVDFSNQYEKNITEFISLFFNNKLDENFVEIFKE